MLLLLSLCRDPFETPRCGLRVNSCSNIFSRLTATIPASLRRKKPCLCVSRLNCCHIFHGVSQYQRGRSCAPSDSNVIGGTSDVMWREDAGKDDHLRLSESDSRVLSFIFSLFLFSFCLAWLLITASENESTFCVPQSNCLLVMQSRDTEQRMHSLNLCYCRFLTHASFRLSGKERERERERESGRQWRSGWSGSVPVLSVCICMHACSIFFCHLVLALPPCRRQVIDPDLNRGCTQT